MKIADIILPNSLKGSIDLGLERRSYGRFKVILFLIMIAITAIPATTIAFLGYINYKNLLQKDEITQLKWQMEGSIGSIEQMVGSLKSVVQFIARKDRYTELTTGSSLEDLFDRLQRQYPSFADLGVIDEQGVQQAYYGSYDLEGTDYSGESWFSEVMEKGLHISPVYRGYRDVPHFAIAVSTYDPVIRKTWVMRATIEADTLQNFVGTIKTEATDDLFLVVSEGVLQTFSNYFGQPLTQTELEIEPGVRSYMSMAQEEFLIAIGDIAATPWYLVIIKNGYTSNSEWRSFRSELFILYVVCMVISVIVIFALVNMLTSLIRKADEIQIGMMKEAEHKDKLASIGRLASGVAHEINNPLAIINQKTGLVEDILNITPDFDHKHTVLESLKSIDNSVERCKAITHRLLGFARRTEVLYQHIDVNETIREVLKFLEKEMMYSRIELDLQLQDNLPNIYSDRLQIQQVLLNIINNAIDAIGKDGTISIISNLIAGEVRIVIQDDGSGIPEDMLSQIFEPFFTTKETGKGTGLGLSITYGLVKKLGGDITVRSNVGKGTAFTITLPVKVEKQ
jgi:two-component system NtrC family sensor kinase